VSTSTTDVPNNRQAEPERWQKAANFRAARLERCLSSRNPRSSHVRLEGVADDRRIRRGVGGQGLECGCPRMGVTCPRRRRTDDAMGQVRSMSVSNREQCGAFVKKRARGEKSLQDSVREAARAREKQWALQTASSSGRLPRLPNLADQSAPRIRIRRRPPGKTPAESSRLRRTAVLVVPPGCRNSWRREPFRRTKLPRGVHP